MNYREAWANGEIEAGTLVDAIESLTAELADIKANRDALLLVHRVGRALDQQRIETAADNCEVLRARLARYEDAEGNALANAVVEIPELRQVVTDALMGMISAVTSLTPPANEQPPPFIQAAIDRAVDRIARLNSSPISAGDESADVACCAVCGSDRSAPSLASQKEQGE